MENINNMQELTAQELQEINGGGWAYDLGYAVGKSINQAAYVCIEACKLVFGDK